MSKRLVLYMVIASFSLCFFLPGKSKSLQQNSLEVIAQSPTELTLSWQIPEVDIREERIDGRSVAYISFSGGKLDESTGRYPLPYKPFRLGVPDGAEVSYQISEIRYETIENLSLDRLPGLGRDKNGISVYEKLPFDKETTALTSSIIRVDEQVYFRDLPIRHIQLYPIRYDPASQTLRIIKSAKIKFKFLSDHQSGQPFIAKSNLDHLYSKMIINFDQAKNWMVSDIRSFAKPAISYEGPWFRFEITQDGLYKISASTLNAAGIDLSGLDPRTIRLFNHGGKPLNPNTNSLAELPAGPSEIAIIVSGEEDGQFDTNDHILFYGISLNGWHYNSSKNDFQHSQHPYDIKNYYLLTYGEGTGKRMEEEATPPGGAGVTDTYFLDRVHFEEDRYNLLYSGADWYGHKFDGRAHEVSQNHPITGLSSTPNQARMRIKFKGGSGIGYLDTFAYRYYFTVWLNAAENPSSIITSEVLAEERSTIFTGNFISTDYLKEGNNAVYIKYTGNHENCSAYLDWIEFYTPRDFQVHNNQLMFYTQTVGQTVAYSISGFTREDIQIFDISDPLNVKKLITSTNVQGGNLNLNLDLSLNQHKRIMVSSLTSPDIITVPGIKRYQPDYNLMDATNSAEFIVITHPAFKSYAEQIVNLRENGEEPLSGTVVTTDDIYFYFSSSVRDVVAIRNFIRYTYYNWSSPRPGYVLLFGDGHYDYRNISLPDTNRVPPFEISANFQLNSRESDNFYVDVNFASNTFYAIQPDLAIGRLPVESHLDAGRIVEKLVSYEQDQYRDGWQTMLTFVADDEVTSRSNNEWGHQDQTEGMARMSNLNKFIKKKIYLSAYESVPGGFGRVKPKANQAIIDQLNEGTLLINYVGHGSPTAWAHESALDMIRDLDRIQNEGKLPLWIAATCDFGKYDNPYQPTFSEALIWQEKKGAIAVISSSRLVYSYLNSEFNEAYLTELFPEQSSSIRLGEALLLATGSGENDQKYHLFGDPTLFLADPKKHIQITGISPDTLKALSKVSLSGKVSNGAGQGQITDFDGGAVLIVNDARYDSVNTGGPYNYTLFGPRLFKGEVSITNGLFSGEFIVPKSIRYHNKSSGRVTVYAWDEETNQDAIGYVDTLLFNGSSGNFSDSDGPQIILSFKDQEQFRDGDLVKVNPVLVAEISDESGINLTQEVGHRIDIQIDDQSHKDITSFFSYDRNSYSDGLLSYHLDDLDDGEHELKLTAWDNLNNPGSVEIRFRIVDEQGLVLKDVVNYPNPFADETNFTFQMLGIDASTQVKIKVYTISGRLIKTMDNVLPPVDGFNYYPWDGRDDDGDMIANGVYLYKIIVKNDEQQQEKIEKLVILR